jgi:acyl-CoA thioesterase-1
VAWNPLTYHFVSGLAFLSGAVMLAAGAAASGFARKSGARVAGLHAAALGAVVVALSAAPLPWWLYAAWAGAAAAHAVLFLLARKGRSYLRPAGAAALLVVTGLSVAHEAPHLAVPRIEKPGSDVVYVIGDSVSAGAGRSDEVTWPAVLQERVPWLQVVNASEPGATALSASGRQADQVTEEGAAVFIEIGGNDLLNRTPERHFERALDELLARVRGQDRVCIMLELPLPPFHNGYGLVQRRLARRHGVALVPRRVFACVLAARGNTVDGIHLSNEGAARMAEVAAEVLASAVDGGN